MESTNPASSEDSAVASGNTDHERFVAAANRPRSFPAVTGKLRWFDTAALVVVGIAAVVLRFWTTTPMWLDEALTVNIARQPLHQIPLALRHDGHPPLYYMLLHGWMAMFGESNGAIRALPGIFGVLAIPATWLVGRRIGGRGVAWCSAVTIAVLPFAIRYSTENRMYSLMMLLVPLGWLCVDSALRRARPLPLIGLVLCTSALLWSQYWAIWLGAATAMIVVFKTIRTFRRGDAEAGRAGLWVLGALGIGAVSFIPWLPTMLYQQAHTGTPWASRAMPPTVIVTSVQALGGAVNATDEVGGWLFTLVIALGLFGFGIASGRIELNLRTRPWIRTLAWPVGLTLVFGVGVMLATNTAFQPRYNAVWLPLAVVIGGAGLAVLQGPILQRCALGCVLAASVFGGYNNVTLARSQAGEAAAAIQRNARPGDVVAVCPDQLGPALTRVLHGDLQVGSYPTFSDPHIVDWSDYVKRTHAATPDAFANDLLKRAGPDGRIFVVWSDGYVTHRKLCTDLVVALTTHRPDNRQILAANGKFFENENVTGFWPGSSS